MVRGFGVASALIAGGLLVGSPALAQSDDGGPDFYEVYDLSTKQHLNLRSGPSLKNRIITGLHMGDKVKNLGCETTAAGRWCQVETSKGTKGYAFGAFLKEAAGDAMAATEAPAAPEAAPAPAPKPAFVMGKLTCERSNGTPTAECTFGLMRVGPGHRLLVTWPDATKRMFGVFSGVVTSGDGKVAAKAGADGSLDISLVPTGAASEHYVVPAGVMDTK